MRKILCNTQFALPTVPGRHLGMNCAVIFKTIRRGKYMHRSGKKSPIYSKPFKLLVAGHHFERALRFHKLPEQIRMSTRHTCLGAHASTCMLCYDRVGLERTKLRPCSSSTIKFKLQGRSSLNKILIKQYETTASLASILDLIRKPMIFPLHRVNRRH